jgi:hypothetical protein
MGTCNALAASIRAGLLRRTNMRVRARKHCKFAVLGVPSQLRWGSCGSYKQPFGEKNPWNLTRVMPPQGSVEVSKPQRASSRLSCAQCCFSERT